MTEEQHCLRCDGQTLVSVESPKGKGITFFECPECKRHYALAKGRTLTDRWLSPITLPLYGTIFSSNPPEDAERVALSFLDQESPERLQTLLEEIDDELSSPKQCLQHIFNQSQSEQSLRLFLRRFSDCVAAHLKPQEQ
jgi:transposase-like protein